jgi:hypothetical protein
VACGERKGERGTYVAGGGLAGNVDVLADDDAAGDLDDAADGEDDDAVGLGDGITERTGARVAANTVSGKLLVLCSGS